MKDPNQDDTFDDPEFLDPIGADDDLDAELSDKLNSKIDDEDGIFAPENIMQKKKKGSSSKVLLGGVAVLAIAGGGAFFWFNQNGSQLNNPAPPVTASVDAQPPVTPPAVTPPAENVPTPPSPDTAVAQGGIPSATNPDQGPDQGLPPPPTVDGAIPAVPVPQSDFAQTSSDAQPPSAQPSGAQPPQTATTTPVPSSDPSAPVNPGNATDTADATTIPTAAPNDTAAVPNAPVPDKQAAPATDPNAAPPSADLPVPPQAQPNDQAGAAPKIEDVALNQTEDQSGDQAAAQDQSAADAKTTAVKPEGDVKLPKGAKIAQPKEQPAPVATKEKSALEKAHEDVKVAEKPADKPMEYFDAPKGKALKDLPPPKINLNVDPGQNIIIVNKRIDDEGVAAEGAVEKGSDTGYVESQIASANRAMALGRYQAALEFFDNALKKNPRDPRILLGRAVALQKLGESQLAIDAYNKVLDVDPGNADALTNLMGLTTKSQPAVALQKLLELRQKYPNNEQIAAQLGVAYAQSGNFEDGIRYLNIASSLNPKNGMHYFNMGVMAERLGNRAKAIEMYEKALDTDSVYSSARGVPRDQIYDRLATLRR